MRYLKDLVWGHFLSWYKSMIFIVLSKIAKSTYKLMIPEYFSSGSIADINRVINADFEDMKIWLRCNKLSLNVLKSQ